MDKLKRMMEGRKKPYVEYTPEDSYREIAQHSDNFTPEDISQIGGLESQHGKFDKPLQGGSAQGLYQFQPETAEELIPGSSKKLSDINVQTALMKLYLERNKQKNPQDAFAMHNLGPTGGEKFINAEDNSPIQDIISENSRESNLGLYGNKTVGNAKKNIKEKLKKAEESADMYPNIQDLLLLRKGK